MLSDHREALFSHLKDRWSGIFGAGYDILLEVPPMPLGGISDAVLLQRLAIRSADSVAAVARTLADAESAAAIHRHFTYRNH